jgi:flagellar L-ring protein precursor FlgH
MMYASSLRRSFALLTVTLVALLMASAPVRAQSLYADPRAQQTGDMLTIILAEQTSAQRASGYENSSNSRLGGSSGINSPDINSTFGVNAQFNKSSENSNETVQSDMLQGQLTARVVEVDDTGNLVVEGERRIEVNGVTHLMRVRGFVRPFDVRSDNTLFSYQIANAEIEYRRAGFTRRFIKPGFMAKAGAVVALGAAIFFGMQ